MTGKLTKRERRELIGESVVPILLGQTLRAHFFAWRLYLRWGAVSFLCGSQKNVFTSLDPVCRFLRTDRQAERLAAEQLTDFADAYGDCLFLLIPLTSADRAFVSDYASQLESRMIVAEPRTLLEHAPFDNCD